MWGDWPMDGCLTYQDNPHFPDRHSPFIRLCLVVYDGLRHSGAQTVHRRVQTGPEGCSGRGRAVSFQVHRGHLPVVR